MKNNKENKIDSDNLNVYHSKNEVYYPEGRFSIDSIQKRNSIISEMFSIASKMTEQSQLDLLVYVKSKNIEEQVKAKGISRHSYAFKGRYERPPLEAPELWPGAGNTSESIPLFLSRVYEKWLGFGMTRADLEAIDTTAYLALRAWERKHATWPDLPTTKEHNDALVAWADAVDEKTLQAALPPAEQNRLAKLRSRRLKEALVEPRTN